MWGAILVSVHGIVLILFFTVGVWVYSAGRVNHSVSLFCISCDNGICSESKMMKKPSYFE